MTAKIIILEGPNGAGKTTLLGELVGRSPDRVSYIHNGPSDHPLSDYLNQACQAFYDRGQGMSTIIDRFNIGEQVYPKVFERTSLISPFQDHALVQALGSLGVRWYVAIPPLARLVTVALERGEDTTREQLMLERAEFLSYLSNLPETLRDFFMWETRNVTVQEAADTAEAMFR